MAIEIRRVNGPIRRKYVLRVTPPHAPNAWESGPISRREGEKKLYEFGNHTQDIAEAFAVANDR
jgi:hypothetical protein